jgi:hypothetical protein
MAWVGNSETELYAITVTAGKIKFTQFTQIFVGGQKRNTQFLVGNQGCGVGVGVVELESEGITGGVGVGKNVPTPTSTSV